MNTSSLSTITTTTTPSRKTTSKSHVAKPTTQKLMAQKLNGKSNVKSNKKSKGKPTAQKSKAQKSAPHVAKPITQKSTAQKPHAAKPTTQKAKATKKRAKAVQRKVAGTPISTPKSYSRPGRPSSPHGIGKFARTLLATELSYDAIIARIRKAFPDAKTSVQCLRWYATKMREENVDMPTRPRKPRIKS